jgi:long-chain fatty acid transport protein
VDNPALISQTGDSVNVAWSMFMPDRKLDTTGAGGFGAFGSDQSSDSKAFGIPQVSFTSKINDQVSWGIMAYALGGMNTDYRTGPFPGAGQTQPQSVNLQGMIVAVPFSYAFNKDITAGASVLFGYESLTTRNLFGLGSFGGTNEGSATGYGLKLGLDWKLADGASLGAVYQPKMSMDEISYFKSFLGQFGFTGDAALTLPAQYGLGGKFAVGKDIDIVADILYYQWSGVDVFDFFGWEDQTVYKLGAEFRTSEKLALRVGFNYGKSPIQGGNSAVGGSMDAAFANYPFPAISETHFTLGLGYKMDKNVTLNAYYLYAPEVSQTATLSSTACSDPTNIPGSCSTIPAGTKISMSQNAFGIGLNYAVK